MLHLRKLNFGSRLMYGSYTYNNSFLSVFGKELCNNVALLSLCRVLCTLYCYSLSILQHRRNRVMFVNSASVFNFVFVLSTFVVE